MEDIFFRIGGLHKKMETNRELQLYMKLIGAMLVFVIFVCSFNMPETMRVAWYITLPIICVLFGFNVWFIRKNKAYEFEIYQLEKEYAKEKEEIAAARGETLSGYQTGKPPEEPSQSVSLPIVYYGVLLVLDILVKVFMIR